MSNFKRTFLFLILAGLSACTDKREPEKKIPVRIERAPREMLQTVGDIVIQKPTQDGGYQSFTYSPYQMAYKNGALYITGIASDGFNLGFARWDVSADPEAPQKVFNVGENIDVFQPIGGWRPDWYGSGAIGILGNYAIMSGVVGASFINMSQSANPVETKRYPMPGDPLAQVPQDPRFVYRAIVAHPSVPLIYGLKEQDGIVVSKVGSSGLTPVAEIPYGPSTVCCTTGATVFGNQLFVGMRGMLRAYELGVSGELSAPTDIRSIQAVNVASTAELLFVQHKPSFGIADGQGRAGGIYVFDKNGDSIAFLPIEPIQFVVSDNNTHIYANMDDTAVRIFRIEWTNR